MGFEIFSGIESFVQASFTAKNRRSQEELSRLSASVSASDERQLKMDRLTASKSMFEKDKFAESLAKVRTLSNGLNWNFPTEVSGRPATHANLPLLS